MAATQRELTWLGVNLNLSKLCFSIPQIRMESIFFLLEKITKNLPYTAARKYLFANWVTEIKIKKKKLLIGIIKILKISESPLLSAG